MRLKNRKLAKRLASIGSSIECSWLVEINNEPSITFDTQDAALDYLKGYREKNVIFSLKMFRVELFSL